MRPPALKSISPAAPAAALPIGGADGLEVIDGVLLAQPTAARGAGDLAATLLTLFFIRLHMRELLLAADVIFKGNRGCRAKFLPGTKWLH